MAILVILDPFDADAGVILAQFQNDGGRPSGDVARDIGFHQRRAPVSKPVGRNGLARAAPDAKAAVIAFQTIAQGLGGNLLQIGIDRRADRQAAPEEFRLAEGGGKLAADFIGEIVARGQRLAEGGVIAVLHGQERGFRLGPGLIAGDVAVFGHPVQNIGAAFQRAVLVADGMHFRRRLGQRGEIGRLARGQRRKRLVEIGLRSGGNAIAVLAKEDLVQVKLKDLVLGQRLLQPGGEDDFLDLAFAGAVARQKEVLHHLLGDGRSPAQFLPARQDRIAEGGGHAGDIIAVMGVEILVLGGDEGVLHQIGDILDRHEKPPFLREFVDDAAFAGIDAADRGGGVLRQAFMAGQVAGIHPEDRADGQRAEQDAQRDGREDGPEE